MIVHNLGCSLRHDRIAILHPDSVVSPHEPRVGRSV
jgi:hypothetical protein